MISAIKKNPQDYFLLLILITLPIGGRAFNSIAVFIFLVFTIHTFFKKKVKLQFNRLSISFVLLFFLGVLSLIWSRGNSLFSEVIVRFLPYLALSSIAFFSYRIQFILNVFAKSILIIAVLCFLKAVFYAVINIDVKFLFYHNLSRNLGDVNAIYLSIFTSFAIIILLYKKNKQKFDIFSLVFLVVFLVLLSSKMIIVITLLLVLIYFFKRNSFQFIKKRYLVFISLFIVLGLASYKLKNRLKVEFEKTKINEVLHKSDFGHIYLWTGTGLRVFQTKLFFEILNERKNYILGLGLYNSQSSLDDKYKEYNLYPGYYGYNYHNQYLQISAELGFLGLVLMLYIFYLLFYKAIVNKDYFLFSFIFLTVAVCITESFLWRQRGMVFFITISLLLYSTKERIS